MRPVVGACILVAGLASAACGDSIFDTGGMGRNVIQAVGPTRALGGAVAASTDPLCSSVANPFASAFATRLTVSAGLVETSTKSRYLEQDRRTVKTLFPSVGLVIPLERLSITTGLYLEKEGRISLADTGTYELTAYDVSYTREGAIYTVPLFVSSRVRDRVILAAGVIFGFSDMREKTEVDFRAGEYSDAVDVADTYAMGEGFAAGLLVDLDRVSISGLFRTGSDLSGSLERSNRQIGVWTTEDVSLASEPALTLGLLARPVSSVSIEVDFDRAAWSQMSLGGQALTEKTVNRFSAGVQYRGDHLWEASRFPLNLGFYTQPLDWENPLLGEITERVFSVGTSFFFSQNRAAASVAVEIGRREAAGTSEFRESTVGVSLSISASEVWRKEVKR